MSRWKAQQINLMKRSSGDDGAIVCKQSRITHAKTSATNNALPLNLTWNAFKFVDDHRLALTGCHLKKSVSKWDETHRNSRIYTTPNDHHNNNEFYIPNRYIFYRKLQELFRASVAQSHRKVYKIYLNVNWIRSFSSLIDFLYLELGGRS